MTRPATTVVRRRTTASAARAVVEASSASTRTSPSPSLVPATSSASGSSRRSSRAGPTGAAPDETDPVSQVEVARQELEEGARRLEAAREDRRKYRQLL